MRVLEPAPGLVAFFDGRHDESASISDADWVESDLILGTASYAVVSDGEAIVFDTHLSLDRGRAIRRELESRGAERFTVVLSHWHLDHIGGTAAFADSEVVSSARTTKQLMRHREAIEDGSLWGAPPIDPLILPTLTFDDRLDLKVGDIAVEAIQVNIHSEDATVLWLPGSRTLLAGDTVEDPVTFVDEPESLATHRRDLARLEALGPETILPAHADPERIEKGGFSPAILPATRAYTEKLERARDEPRLRGQSVEEFLEDWVDQAGLSPFGPYEDVHRHNLGQVAKMPR